MRQTTKNLNQTSITMIKINYKVTRKHLEHSHSHFYIAYVEIFYHQNAKDMLYSHC